MTPTGKALLDAIDALAYDAWDAPRHADLADGTWEGAIAAIEREAAEAALRAAGCEESE